MATRHDAGEGGVSVSGVALLGIGQVRHQRLRPVRHGFDYPTYFLMLPLRALRETPCTELRRNRFGQ